jgi:hypothetical protein
MNSRTPIEHPGRQRRCAQRLAGIDIVLYPLRHLLPAGGLPGFEGAELLAKAPAHGEVDVACVVGNGFEMYRDVVEGIAEDGPEELRLRMRRFAQRLHALGRILLLEDAPHQIIGLATAGHVLPRCEVQTLDFLAHFLVKACACFLAQCPGGHEFGQYLGCLVHGGEGIVRQGVLHGLDHMAHGIEADHVSSAEGGGLGAPEPGPGQVIHHVA